MEINTSSYFDKKYKKLSQKLKDKAKQKEILFRADRFHPSLETHKLHGKDRELWAFSIDRKYRIKFAFVSRDHVLFVDIGTHDVYR